MTQAQQRLRELEAKASALPAPSVVGINLYWERGALHASLSSEGSQISVNFGSASLEVGSIEEGVAILRGIFADEIVWVTGYCDSEPVYFALGRADAPMALIGTLDRCKSSIEVPRIDDVDIVRWSEG